MQLTCIYALAAALGVLQSVPEPRPREPVARREKIVVTATILGASERIASIPGSATILDLKALDEIRVFTAEEALRQAPGVHARAEDAFGLRPNLGIRGLNPTRSTRVLLLEDGLPLSYAPYGDNASYYHPPVERFESVEILKGSGQILYGPMTVGGVINYLTPPPPQNRAGMLTLAGGNRSNGNAHLRFGGPVRQTGVLLDAMHKQGQGARENTRHGVTDLNAKSLTPLGSRQTLGLRLNYYTEDSNLTYSGLREEEYRLNPRGNPFRNDFLRIDRYGASAVHAWAPRSGLAITTSSYGSVFVRDWWRQSSHSNQRPNDSADPACGGIENLHTSCGNEGRLRRYDTWGVEPKVHAAHRLFGLSGEADFGARLHFETQERIQENGERPDSRSGRRVEDNQRTARAISSFVQNRFQAGRWSFTPGLRLESVAYRRTNRLANNGLGVTGATSLTKWIPGLGVAWQPSSRVAIFSGVHRGFAPPRVEDVIDNATGASTELNPETSWIYEAGIRLTPARELHVEAAFFRMDFENQVVPSSVAGGLGATLTNAGETLHQGAEFSWRWRPRGLITGRHGISLRGAWTWLQTARYQGSRFSAIPGFNAVRITGNRLPYAPEHLLTAGAGWLHTTGASLVFESVFTGLQFGDDLNSRAPTPDGQRGLLPGAVLWNATFQIPVERVTFFLAAKNVFDRTVIVDRSRGILPGMGRQIHLGIRLSF